MKIKCKLKKYAPKNSTAVDENISNKLNKYLVFESVCSYGKEIEMEFLGEETISIGKLEDVKANKKTLYITTDKCYVDVLFIEDYVEEKEIALA